jgi:hypothetical protein
MKKGARSSAPAASATARKRAPKKAVMPLDKAYKRMYHAFFLKVHENAPREVRYAVCDDSVEFLPWRVFIGTDKIDDGVGYTDPLKTVQTAIIKLCLDIHERVRAAFSAQSRDPEFIAQLAKIAQPYYEYMKPCDDDDTTDFVNADLRPTCANAPEARIAAAAVIRIVKRLACAHAACVLTCHKMPKAFITALCYAAALPKQICELSIPAPIAEEEEEEESAPAEEEDAAPAPEGEDDAL